MVGVAKSIVKKLTVDFAKKRWSMRNKYLLKTFKSYQRGWGVIGARTNRTLYNSTGQDFDIPAEAETFVWGYPYFPFDEHSHKFPTNAKLDPAFLKFLGNGG